MKRLQKKKLLELRNVLIGDSDVDQLYKIEIDLYPTTLKEMVIVNEQCAEYYQEKYREMQKSRDVLNSELIILKNKVEQVKRLIY